MKTKNFVCLFAILVANNGLANNVNTFDIQKEYQKCMRSETCKKRHTQPVWTNWDVIKEYMQITGKNLEKLKLEKKQKEEQKKKKKEEEEKKRKKEEEDMKKEAEKMRREQDEYIKKFKKWYGRMKF